MQVNIDGKMIKLPDFLIVGAARSGTTSLYHYLKQHPQIFMPEDKEPWFFPFADVKDDEIFKRKSNIVTDFDEYTNLFKDARDSQVLGEGSTIYLYLYKETIANIKRYHPDWKNLKIVIIIRNPVERAFSHYLVVSANGVINFSFEELVKKCKLKQVSKYSNVVDYGFYYNQIKNYKDTFDHVKIFLYEDLKEDSKQLVQGLYSFLDVETTFIPDTTIEHNISINSNNILLNKFLYKQNLFKNLIKPFIPLRTRVRIKNTILKKIARKPEIKRETKKFLTEVYKEEILRLQDLINRDLKQWLICN